MNSKEIKPTHFQTIKVAKFWDFTTEIIKKQNREDFAELVQHNKLSMSE